MTSIEWLKAEYIKRGDSLPSGVFEDAKEMHKQEIMNAVNQNEFEDIDGMGISETITKGEQYYQETFVSKGSDEHIVDTNEMIEIVEKETYPEYPDRIWLHGDGRKLMSSQKEISDKDIFNVAYDKYVIEDEIEAFIKGANWMQEQLKTK
jgi:hypothetical protein